MATYDNDSGEYIKKPRFHKKPQRLGDVSFGASIWELLHPAQVIAENGPAGSPPTTGAPTTYGDVFDQAIDDIATAERETATTAVNVISDTTKTILIGLAIIAVIMVADRMPSQGRVKAYGRKQVKRLRRHVAKRIAG